MEIQKLNKQELEELLKDLRLYRDLRGKLGKRGIELFKRGSKGVDKLVVEYFKSTGEELAFSKSLEVYKTFFNITPKKEEIIFIAKDYLQGGIKVYKNDNLVDLSFSKVENLLKG